MAETAVIEDQEDLAQFFADLASDFEGLPASQSGREFGEGGVEIAEESMRQGFAQSRSPGGEAWAPNKPATIKRKGHNAILRDKGQLGVSLTDSGHPDAIVEIANEPAGCGFTRGTSVPHSAPNQTGTKHTPARPHVGLTEDACDELAELGADLAIEHLKAGA